MILALVLLSFVYIGIFGKSPSQKYPVTIEINKGDTLHVIASKLHDRRIIKHVFVFENFMKVLKKDRQIKTGEYTFKRPMNAIEIADKLVNARYEYIPVVLTIYEGEDTRTITDRIYANFKNVSASSTRDELFTLLKDKEGRLFPETYNFAPWATLDDVLLKIDTEFKSRTAKYNLSEEQLLRVLTVASILEKEVATPKDMKVVSGLIYNRLKIDMRLQMDSTLGYVTGKGSLQLSLDDLKNDSLYNTYKVKGLPPGPIGNPGDLAIDAAINPDTNDYLFFLSDSEGNNYYTKSYAEHLKNRKTYLGK